MSSVIDALYQLKYNPFKYGEHIASFYSTIQNVEKNLLLAPLIIPLCTHPTFGTSLSSAVFGEKKRAPYGQFSTTGQNFMTCKSESVNSKALLKNAYSFA